MKSELLISVKGIGNRQILRGDNAGTSELVSACIEDSVVLRLDMFGLIPQFLGRFRWSEKIMGSAVRRRYDFREPPFCSCSIQIPGRREPVKSLLRYQNPAAPPVLCEKGNLLLRQVCFQITGLGIREDCLESTICCEAAQEIVVWAETQPKSLNEVESDRISIEEVVKLIETF